MNMLMKFHAIFSPILLRIKVIIHISHRKIAKSEGSSFLYPFTWRLRVPPYYSSDAVIADDNVVIQI